MTLEGTRQRITTSLTLGVQLDEFDYRLFLRDYHRDLRHRHPSDSFPAYSPNIVLDTLMPRVEPACQQGVAGGRYDALRAYCKRAHRLDLTLAASDYGPLEKRSSPYGFDRASFYFGRELMQAEIELRHPGPTPYRSTRELPIPFVREHLDAMLELLPDYLWWALQDRRDMLRNILAPEQLAEIRRRIEGCGFKLDRFGLYLTTFEALHPPSVEGDDEP